MLETQPDRTHRSTVQVLLGFLLGVAFSLGFLIFAIFLGMTFGSRHAWLLPVLNGVGLMVAGIIALRHLRESSYALGMVIALSLAFVLNTACGVLFVR